jgi:hypothetical protein
MADSTVFGGVRRGRQPARAPGPMRVGSLYGGTVRWNQIWDSLSAEILAGMAAGFVHVALNARRATAPTAAVPTVTSASSIAASS